MWWKFKAAVHRGISLLPDRLSYSAHFFLQRRFGRLAGADPSLEHFRAGKTFADTLTRQGRSLEGSTVLELGTGWHLDFSIALWLCGAEKVITADVNPYLQPKLVLERLAYAKANGEKIRTLFGSLADTPLFQERLSALVDVPHALSSLLELTGIRYYAPADTAHLDLPDKSVDYYFSYSVVQYIPPAILEEVLREGIRVLKERGVHVHAIDMADWFARSDPSISRVNFLRFSEREWMKLAGNRYMYQNRMRIDEYTALFARMGFTILQLEVTRDQESMDLLKAGFPLDGRFVGKSIETNAASSAWIAASIS